MKEHARCQSPVSAVTLCLWVMKETVRDDGPLPPLQLALGVQEDTWGS